MNILLLSIVLGLLGLSIGSALESELFAIFGGIIGFLAPPFYFLEKIYNKVIKDAKTPNKIKEIDENSLD